MATAQASAAPAAGTTTLPNGSNAVAPEPSGAAWVARFPTSASVDDCAEPFRQHVSDFIAALRAAGATVKVSATLRPPQRAHLMHWCWCIVKGLADPRTVPLRNDVGIAWAHVDAQGAFDRAASVAGAQAMVNAYGMQNLKVAPALESRHIDGLAVDMNIDWTGTLQIKIRNGTVVQVAGEPRTGMNPDLRVVGATYGVIKFVGGASDMPHWSDNGH